MNYEEAKDQAAKECGYNDWNDLFDSLGHHVLRLIKNSQFEYAIDRAMQIYAEAKAKEFAKWCSVNSWEYNPIDNRWHDSNVMQYPKPNLKTTSELYNIFNG